MSAESMLGIFLESKIEKAAITSKSAGLKLRHKRFTYIFISGTDPNSSQCQQTTEFSCSIAATRHIDQGAQPAMLCSEELSLAVAYIVIKVSHF